jgi:hypothetical protein
MNEVHTITPFPPHNQFYFYPHNYAVQARGSVPRAVELQCITVRSSTSRLEDHLFSAIFYACSVFAAYLCIQGSL